MTNNYAFTFGELDSSTANDGYGGLFIKFRTEQTINYIDYEVGEKKPAILFDMRTNPIDWSLVTSPLLVNGKGLAVNKTSAPNVGLDIGTNDAIRVPVGTTGQRPDSAETGYIRYNSSTNDFEGYKNTGWTSLSGQIDISDNTNLSVGTGLTLSDDTITVDAAQSGITSVGTLSSLNVDGNVGIGTTSPSCKLHVVDSSSEGKIIIENETLALLQLKQPTSNKTYNIELGRTDGELTFRSTTGERMRLTESGNLGIGISSPQDSLHINGNMRLGQNGIIWAASGTHDHSGSLTLRASGNGTSSSAVHQWHAGAGGELKIGGLWSNGYLEYKHADITRFIVKHGGYVGIGTSSPTFPLHITSGTTSNGNLPNQNQNYIRYDGSGVNALNFGANSYDFSIYCSKSIFSERYIAASDSRIKDNIEDIPDDTALQMVRDIPCRYYTYRDVVDRGSNRTIGFIAQEVKDVIPEAVDEISEYIPDEYRLLTASNKQWSYTNGEYHLKVSDLEITPNSSYRFIVGNNDGIDQETLEIEPNSDDTFTFSKTWSKIFLYGSRVNDFNVLDKQKIFAVHHAAIQELDRINTEQAQRIQTLETQLTDVVARLTALENA